MGQEVNVAVIKRQITEKLSALETAISFNAKVQDQMDKISKDSHNKFDKAYKAWNDKAIKAVVKAINADNSVLSIETRYGRYDGVNITVKDLDLAVLANRPVRPDIDADGEWSKLRKSMKEVPYYYDHRGDRVHPDVVIFHFKKALDLLEALPQGTVTVTVKDFNFLTRY